MAPFVISDLVLRVVCVAPPCRAAVDRHGRERRA
jgi:hypothetical protein